MTLDYCSQELQTWNVERGHKIFYSLEFQEVLENFHRRSHGWRAKLKGVTPLTIFLLNDGTHFLSSTYTNTSNFLNRYLYNKLSKNLGSCAIQQTWNPPYLKGYLCSTYIKNVSAFCDIWVTRLSKLIYFLVRRHQIALTEITLHLSVPVKEMISRVDVISV